MVSARWREAAAALLASAGLALVLWHLRRAAAEKPALPGDSKEDKEKQTGAARPATGVQSPPEASNAPTAPAPPVGQDGQKLNWKSGDVATIRGLKAKPAFNGSLGTLVRLLPDKGRWVVQLQGEAVGSREPLLVREENLGPPPPSEASAASDRQAAARASAGLPPAPQLRVPAVLCQHPVREVQWNGQAIRLFGVASYSSSVGADEVFREMEDFRPGVVLMESFDVGEDIEVDPGDELPYRQLLGQGLGAALRDVGDKDFRRAWSVEAVAVLAALRVGAEVRLCDRLHVASFDRLIARLSLDELKLRLLQATEAIANVVEQLASREAAEAQKARRRPRPIGFSDLPQNSLCSFFEELGSERRIIAAHFARIAAEKGNDVMLVIGAEHIAEVEECLQSGCQGNLEELLGPHAAGGEDESDWQGELERRTLVAAFLNSTRTFPPEVVLLPREQLLPEYGDQVAKIYPKYREMFLGRFSAALEAAGSQQTLEEAATGEAQKPRVRGLAQLHDFRLEG